MVLFLAVTAKQQAVEQKIKNFLTKWRQVQQKIPLPEMTELLITPQLPEYPKIAHDVFMLLLDGKLRSRTETLKFLKPFAPPPSASAASAKTRPRRQSGDFADVKLRSSGLIDQNRPAFAIGVMSEAAPQPLLGLQN
jgi:hypothetical protein